jgi:hypothetical protein
VVGLSVTIRQDTPAGALLGIENLPHEPLWFAYSLAAPPTRPFAVAGLMLLVAAAGVATVNRVLRLGHRRPRVASEL